MIWTAEALAVIDQRIQAALTVDPAVGTVASVQAGALRAMVTIDGSSLAVPVKLASHIVTVAGDRVGLERYGSDWIVTACFIQRWLDEDGINQAASAGTTTSASYATMPGTPTFTFTKRWTSTRVRVPVHVSAYNTTSTDTGLKIGVRFTSTAGVDTDYDVARFLYNPVNQHLSFGATAYLTGVAADTWTVKPIWARYVGSGTLTQDTGDWVSAAAAEIGP